MYFKSGNIEFFLLLIISSIAVAILPNFFSTIEPDSLGYINNSVSRKSLYPMFLDFLRVTETDNHFNIRVFQILIQCSSIIFLVQSFKRANLIRYTSLILYFLIFFNIYYVSFSKTILTESLFFSFINFSVGIIIKIIFENKNKFFLLGICLGFVCAIKSIGITLSLSFLLLLIFIKKPCKKRLIGLFFGIIIFPIIEFAYQKDFNKNDMHNSIIYRSILGKVFMISGKEHFDVSKFDKENSEFLNKLRNESVAINVFLNKVRNPYLFFDLIADYEVIGQYQVIDLNIETKERLRGLFFEIIKTYPKDYLKISLSHYLGLWLPGSKRIFLPNLKNDSFLKDIPSNSKLERVTGDILNVPKLFLLANLIFFNLIFIFFSFCTLFTLKRIFSFKANTLDLMIVSIQLYLVCVAFLNVSTPRYFMAIYPLTLVLLATKFEELFYFTLRKLFPKLNY